MKTNQESGHFDFVIERVFITISCRGTMGLIPWGLIETCYSTQPVTQRNKKVGRKKVSLHGFKKMDIREKLSALIFYCILNISTINSVFNWYYSFF